MHRIYIIASNKELEIPVLPAMITVSSGGRNKRQTVLETGEVLKLESGGLTSVEWESFFPTHSAPYVTGALTDPPQAVALLKNARESKIPVRLLAVGGGMELNIRVGIDDFRYDERFGEVGDIYYSIKLTEWKSSSPRRITIPADPLATSVYLSEPERPGAPDLPRTYTVVAGDTLWMIAHKYYGDGNRYQDVYNANRSVIDPVNQKWGNPKYTIYPGQVLVIDGYSPQSFVSTSAVQQTKPIGGGGR